MAPRGAYEEKSLESGQAVLAELVVDLRACKHNCQQQGGLAKELTGCRMVAESAVNSSLVDC